ncbi:MAG TPA: hypothetical protein PK675_00465 [Clostridia bacterium]|nr:hypothetical protein [Clostridia bacterium]
MLTTSRREVSIDRYNRLSNKDSQDYATGLDIANDEISVEQPVRRWRDINNNTDENEYSLESIGAKLYGGVAIDTPDAERTIRNETSLPSARTLNYKNPAYSEKDYTEKTIVHSVSKTKGKIAVAAYIAIILALAIAIAFTAISVSSTFASTSALTEEIAAQSATIDTLAAELSTVDEATLIAAAQTMGFSLPNTTNTLMYDTPVTRGPQTFDLSSNWFDKLCDGLCRFFGGN